MKLNLELIRALIAEGVSDEGIRAELGMSDEADMDAVIDWQNDPQNENPYGISADDRFDSRGRELLPRVNEAGEPNWM